MMSGATQEPIVGTGEAGQHLCSAGRNCQVVKDYIVRAVYGREKIPAPRTEVAQHLCMTYTNGKPYRRWLCSKCAEHFCRKQGIRFTPAPPLSSTPTISTPAMPADKDVPHVA